MSLEHYCPVQSSINRYCAALGEDEAFDMAVDNRKDDIMNNLTPEHIQEALSEVPDEHYLWKEIAKAVKQMNGIFEVSLKNALNLIDGIFCAVETYAEQEALRQIKDEQDNPPLEDNGDDH